MRFPFIVTALLFSLLLLTPLHVVVRLAAGGSLVQYCVVLATMYGMSIAAFWAFRHFLRFSEQWDRFGLADLDQGIVGAWPLRWSIILTLGLVAIGFVGLLRSFGFESTLRLVEYAVAGLAIIIAAMDVWHGRRLVVPDDPLPTIVVPDEARADDQDELKELFLSWYFKRDASQSAAQSFTAKVSASLLKYRELKGHDHSVRQLEDFARYVRDGRTAEVHAVVRQLREFSVKHRFSPLCEVNNVLAFAQRFRYESDMEAKGVAEYPKYPLETFVDDAGDCEDHAIVAAACLIELGHDVRLVGVEYPGETAGHMALAVAGAEDAPAGFYITESGSGKRFFYCEATADAVSTSPSGVSFRMGEVPSSAGGAELTLIPI